MITIDPTRDSPLTDQVADGLRFAIACGELQPGDALPPVRQLAADLRVHFNTVARAYRALEAEGLVHTARGRGTRVTAARQAEIAGAEVRMRSALRHALTQARLGGLDRRGLEALLVDEIGKLWPEPSPDA